LTFALASQQNIDWHSDTGNHQALFWDHKDFQDRTILIWERLAEASPQLSIFLTRILAHLSVLSFCDHQHYKDNTWIAGYNPLNEPTDIEHTRLLAFYERCEKAIRKIDSNHILFLE
jgi:hypothetical protein